MLLASLKLQPLLRLQPLPPLNLCQHPQQQNPSKRQRRRPAKAPKQKPRQHTWKIQEHGSDVPPNLPAGPAGPKQYLAAAFRRFQDINVTIEDIIGEGDKVVVRNTWRAIDSTNGNPVEISGIVIWRIAHGQLVERWAYLQASHPVHKNADPESALIQTLRAVLKG